MTPAPYRKLTRKRRGITGYTQLWMGSDHLLLVHSLRVVERYKRFAFRDIEAIVITEAADAWGLRALAILAAVGWGSIGLAVSSYGARAFFWITALLGIAFVVLDIARGPRRKCVLKTAITSEQLRPVSRKKTADDFVATVSQAVQSVQGVVEPLEPGHFEPASIQVQPMAPEPPSQETSNNRGYLPEILFAVLFFDAALVWVGIQSIFRNVTGLLPTIYLAELVLSGVVSFRRMGLGMFVKTLAIATLVLCVADISTVSGVVAFKEVMNTTRAPQDRVPLSSLFLSQQATAIASAGWRVVIGALGITKSLVDRLAKSK